ncbi:MAG: hypothetical protein DSY55_03090 [Clostridia bacterium]|nr:MAG: hypothetical protein DSY55_03090 [Clostridia bacterium]
MPHHVPGDVRRARSRTMHALAARMKAETLARYLGQTRQVLWEGPGEELPSGQLRWTGYTENYLRVETLQPAGRSLENQVRATHLSGLAGAPPDRFAGELHTSAPGK